jgi:hypothetical protein
MKRLVASLLSLISTFANALPTEPEEFNGLTSSERAAGCQLRFIANVDYLLKRADAAVDSAAKQDLRRTAGPVAGMSILAGLSAGEAAKNPSERVKQLGAFDPGSSRHDIGGYCIGLFLTAYLQYSKETPFRTEVAKLLQARMHERYLAAGGIPKYAKEPLLATGLRGVLLGTLAADAERQLLAAYPRAKIDCLPLEGMAQSFHCHVAPTDGSKLTYANMPTSSLIYYLQNNRVVGFGVIYSAAQEKQAFLTLGTNLRSLILLKPQSDYDAGGPANTLAWQSGQEFLQLQNEPGEGTYLTYGVQSFLTQMAKSSLPASQSEKGM